jgi:hypothetical protein
MEKYNRATSIGEIESECRVFFLRMTKAGYEYILIFCSGD